MRDQEAELTNLVRFGETSFRSSRGDEAQTHHPQVSLISSEHTVAIGIPEG